MELAGTRTFKVTIGAGGSSGISGTIGADWQFPTGQPTGWPHGDGDCMLAPPHQNMPMSPVAFAQSARFMNHPEGTT
jgi:hypothetical protein